MSRAEDFRFATDVGIVLAVYPREWAIDILAANGSIVRRATVVGSRMPEVSTTERPQWALFGWIDHSEGSAWARGINRELPAGRADRGDFLYYEEAGRFRISIDRSGTLELRNRAADDTADDAPVHRVVIQEADGVVLLETPNCRLRLRESDQGADLTVSGPVTINCQNATVTVTETCEVRCDDIALGRPATEPAVLGYQLSVFWAAVKLIFDGHVHTEGGNPPTADWKFPAWLQSLLSEVTRLK